MGESGETVYPKLAQYFNPGSSLMTKFIISAAFGVKLVGKGGQPGMPYGAGSSNLGCVRLGVRSCVSLLTSFVGMLSSGVSLLESTSIGTVGGISPGCVPDVGLPPPVVFPLLELDEVVVSVIIPTALVTGTMG